MFKVYNLKPFYGASRNDVCCSSCSAVVSRNEKQPEEVGRVRIFSVVLFNVFWKEDGRKAKTYEQEPGKTIQPETGAFTRLLSCKSRH